MNTSQKKESAIPGSVQTTIAPWLTFRDCAKAVDFYKAAFGAVETYRLDARDGGLIVKLSINGAEFWAGSGATENNTPELIGSGTIRMILTVADPYSVLGNAINAGAKEIFPVGEGHGWLLGRIADPFGLHWEIGHPLTS